MKPTPYLFRIFSFSLLMIWACDLNAQVKFSNDYLSIGLGAKAHGMGKAVVAHINDADAGYWNPAGLVGIESPFQVNLMHAEWFAGIAKYDYISIAKPLGEKRKSAFGLTAIRLGTDNIPYTFNLIGADGSVNYEDVTGFSAADYAVLASFGHKVGLSGLSIGGSAKLIYRGVGRFATAWGFGIDLGVQYKKGQWAFGLMGRDLTSTFNAWKFDYSDAEQVILEVTGNDVVESSVEITRPRFILGTAFNTRKQKDQKFGALIEMDLDFTTDGQRNVLISSNAFNMDLNLGAEIDYKRFIFLRAGINNFQRVEQENGNKSLTLQPNIGLGVKVSVFNIDYALSNVGNVSDALYSHIVSLKINFRQKQRSNKKEKDIPKKSSDKDEKEETGFPDFIEQID